MNIAQHKKRFPLSKVFLVVLGTYIFFWLVGMGLSFLMPEWYRHDVYFKKWYFIGQAAGCTFFTFFYFFLLNNYYNLFAGKKGFVHFLVPSVTGSIVLIAYLIAEINLISAGDAGNQNIRTRVVVFNNLIWVLFLLGVNLLIAYLFYLQDEKKHRKVLEEQKLQLEVEKSHANYNFLKAQINPHFLHNTLNFLYAKSLPYSPELSEGILTLSEIMRYALGENSVKDGKAALKNEIEHMRNIIKIHQLRFGNSLQVNFEVNGIVNGALIIPFVLITIVENAFKHGNLKSAEHPIDIKLTIEHNNLYFYCRNKKKTGPKELSTGIGLDNIKKRLDLAYGNQYSLNIKDEADFYTTQLTIHTL
jgi:two-component system LytT family sensor kinase